MSLLEKLKEILATEEVEEEEEEEKKDEGVNPEHSEGVNPEHSEGVNPEHSEGVNPEHSEGVEKAAKAEKPADKKQAKPKLVWKQITLGCKPLDVNTQSSSEGVNLSKEVERFNK